MLFPDPNGHVDYFGGFAPPFYQLTMWQWNGSDWTQLFPPTVPFARSSAAVATNPVTGQVVMFGGLADVIRSTPGRTTERHGLCSRRALNFHGCMELAPLTILS